MIMCGMTMAMAMTNTTPKMKMTGLRVSKQHTIPSRRTTRQSQVRVVNQVRVPKVAKVQVKAQRVALHQVTIRVKVIVRAPTAIA